MNLPPPYGFYPHVAPVHLGSSYLQSIQNNVCPNVLIPYGNVPYLLKNYCGIVPNLRGIMAYFQGITTTSLAQAIMYPKTLLALRAATIFAAGRNLSGPDGSNLFVDYLPLNFADIHLSAIFAPFGHVISAKVYVDKVTKHSKGFGIVSFDDPLSAQNAIKYMNGFEVGKNRLQVQLKRSKTSSKHF